MEDTIFPELLKKKENNEMINLTDYTRKMVVESLSNSESVEDLVYMFACLNQEIEPIPEE